MYCIELILCVYIICVGQQSVRCVCVKSNSAACHWTVVGFVKLVNKDEIVLPLQLGLKNLSTSYTSVLRRLLGICKPFSASKMFVSRGIPTFAELLHYLFIGLHKKLSTVQIVLL